MLSLQELHFQIQLLNKKTLDNEGINISNISNELSEDINSLILQIDSLEDLHFISFTNIGKDSIKLTTAGLLAIC